MSVVAADFNRDGWLDLASANVFSRTVDIHWGGRDGFSLARSWTCGIANPRFLSYADLNQDGFLDLVIPSPTEEITILWGGRQGFSKERATKLAAIAPVGAKAVDLDGDGWLDLVVANFWDPETHSGYVNSYVYWGGPGGFSLKRRQELPAIGPHAAVIGDLNQDGQLDIVFPDYHGPYTRSVDTYIYWDRRTVPIHPDIA